MLNQIGQICSSDCHNKIYFIKSRTPFIQNLVQENKYVFPLKCYNIENQLQGF